MSFTVKVRRTIPLAWLDTRMAAYVLDREYVMGQDDGGLYAPCQQREDRLSHHLGWLITLISGCSLIVSLQVNGTSQPKEAGSAEDTCAAPIPPQVRNSN